MSKKVLITITLFFLILSVNILADHTVYYDLKTDIYPGLKKDFKANYFTQERLEELLFNLVKRQFLERKINVVTDKAYCDFKLSGTVHVKQLPKKPYLSSFYILIESEDMEISPMSLIYPSLIFCPFNSRDNTGGVKSRKVFEDAVKVSLNDFLAVMQKKSVFDFDRHPLFGVTFELNKQQLESMSHMELRLGIKNMIAEIKKTNILIENVTAKYVELKQEVSFNKKEIRNNYLTINTKLEKIVNEVNLPANVVERIYELGQGLNDLKLMNSNSIVIVVSHVKGIPADFHENLSVIVPRTKCTDCKDEIFPGYFKTIVSEKEIMSLGQEELYVPPFRIKGELIVNPSGSKYRCKIKVDPEKFKQIFVIDRIKEHAIGKSVRDKSNIFPRILILIKK